jgi:class 3 adenylate cyclase/tetratricopeptide (TPR) repeat protein
MTRCRACGHDNQADARFCSQCAAPMIEAQEAPREERKVITVVFADLVGFTARSEQLDPEDVRAFLSPYYTGLRTRLEGYGGTVEKFIGDAVMALFGAPAAHEDDPERAVRAALAIRDWMVEQTGDLQLRIGVNTGEALVALGARPSQGEGMASGDVVNTSARLQTAAPVNGILVGEATYRATSHVINYRQAEPVTANGKALRVPAWEAIEARSRFGVDLARMSQAPLVGREHELGVLTDALKRVRREGSPQFVTLASVPGMGKTRLVAELFKIVDADPSDIIAWRQGRSLPYGDGVTFWALAEMVKAQAGILESDSSARAEERLRTSVAALIADPADARWVEGHLRPLAGLSSSIETGSDRREEAFAAWRRFFEALAEQDPLVLVFEDLHWADDNLLDFVEHLVEWVAGVPMLVVCTARPELFEGRSGWGGGMRNSTTVWLAPLSEEETGGLITNLSRHRVIAEDMRRALVERAGGNPLYAEQYVRMLEERGGVVERELPETVQGIIAARLDLLPIEEKYLLQGAAVVGKVFWLGALTAVVGADRASARLRLHSLERKDFVQRARRSSVADEEEYSYLHVLVRDVAYGQIPRGQRSEQHRQAAEWIGSLGRIEDHAEMLAYHYTSAIDLRRATGQAVDGEMAARARASLRVAGDRASSLSAWSSAAMFYSSALELAPTGSPEHGHLLFHLGRARFTAGDMDVSLLSAACDELIAVGDREAAAQAESVLADMYWFKGHRDAAFAHLERARELVDTSQQSRVKASVLASISRKLAAGTGGPEAIRMGREALGMADQLGLDDVRASALISIGTARAESGDIGAIEDLEQAVAIAGGASLHAEVSRAKANLANAYWERGELRRAYALFEEAEDAALRFGVMNFARWLRGERVAYEYVIGKWHQALRATEQFLLEVEAGSPHVQASACYMARAQIELGRGDVGSALADVEIALEAARLANDPQFLCPILAEGAYVFRETGDVDRARVLANEFLADLRPDRGPGNGMVSVHVLAWSLTTEASSQGFLRALPTEAVPWVLAARAFATGDLRQAADICASMGALTEEARDRLWLAAKLVKEGQAAEARVELHRALAFYRSVDATRYITEAETLLAELA